MLAFSAALVFSNCQSLNAIFKEPVVSLRSVELTGISFTGAELLCKVNVENPNNFNTFASLRGSKSVDYKIALDIKIAFAD